MNQQTGLSHLLELKNVFLTGEPGSGKTHVIRRFVKELEVRGISYAVSAPTGLAASHIGGQTVHSLFGIGIKKGLTPREVDQIARKPWVWKRLLDLKVLIIDEISMLHPTTLDDINKVLQEIKRNDLPFGGVCTVVVGDFFQLPPVSAKIKYAFETQLWKDANFTVCYITEQHRQKDSELLRILRAIRNQTITPEDKAFISNNSPAITPEIRLYTHNRDTRSLNLRELARLPGDEQVYRMVTQGDSAHIKRLT